MTRVLKRALIVEEADLVTVGEITRRGRS